MVSYLEFREKLLPEGCFSVHQARAYFPSFDRNSVTKAPSEEMLQEFEDVKANRL